MRAAVYLGEGAVRMEEREVPRPGPGEVLVAMRACGICGSDLMQWYQDPRAPVVLGHEPVGVVLEAAGDELPQAGTRVFIHHHVPCGECEYCRRGHETLCDTFKATRIEPGGFSELILVPALNAALDLLVLPDHVSDEAATLIEPLACCARGADVTVAEPREDRRALATSLGARGVPPEVEAVGSPTVVMLATGVAAAWELAVASADRGGIIQLFAPSGPGERRDFGVDDLFFRELEIQASYSAGPTDTRAALALIADGHISADKLITHRFPLEETEAALAAARSKEGIKVIVTVAS